MTKGQAKVVKRSADAGSGLWSAILIFALMMFLLFSGGPAQAREEHFTPDGAKIPYKIFKDWPRTDHTKYSVRLYDFKPAGPRKDEIPAINNTKFRDITAQDVGSREPVITLSINGEAKAWPISILIWHEIVNDTVGGVPVGVTFSPLTNSSRVFKRIVDGQVTPFGTSGLQLETGQIFYDKVTQSWWQQIEGKAVYGTSTGTVLEALPARIEGLGAFAARHPDGKMLIPSSGGYRPYGRTPYPRYDSSKVAYHYKGEYKGAVPPMTRLIVVDGEAWSLDLIRSRGILEVQNESGNLRMSYVTGQNSPFDKTVIAKSRDIGSVVVERLVDGAWADAVYDVPFAYAYKAFHPHHSIHH